MEIHYLRGVIRLLSFLLIAQFGYALSLKAFYVLDWKLNQEYITEKYCENKNKPMMNCNGKCYLAKQLEKLEEQEQQERNEHPNPIQKIQKAEVLLFLNDRSVDFKINMDAHSDKRGEWLKTMISQPHLSVPFAPPQV